VSKTHGDHDDPPHDHDHGNKDAGSQPLEQDVGKRFEEGVRDEEYGQSGIVLPVGHAKIFLQTIDFRISNVGPIMKWSVLRVSICAWSCIGVPVEEGDQIEETEPWNELPVELAQQFLVDGSSFFGAQTGVRVETQVESGCADVLLLGHRVVAVAIARFLLHGRRRCGGYESRAKSNATRRAGRKMGCHGLEERPPGLYDQRTSY